MSSGEWETADELRAMAARSMANMGGAVYERQKRTIGERGTHTSVLERVLANVEGSLAVFGRDGDRALAPGARGLGLAVDWDCEWREREHNEARRARSGALTAGLCEVVLLVLECAVLELTLVEQRAPVVRACAALGDLAAHGVAGLAAVLDEGAGGRGALCAGHGVR